MKKIAEIIDFFFAEEIKIVSIYLLSADNINRDKENVNAVCSAETKFLKVLVPEIVKKYEVKVVCAGDVDKYSEKLPDDYKNAVLEICKKTEKNEKCVLNLLIAYDPIDELKQAIEKDSKNFMDYLWVKDDVDFLIRTGFEKRISNFLPLQCRYAELDIIKKYLPDVTIDDINISIKKYLQRDRRFGK